MTDLIKVYTRLFVEDVERLKKIAETKGYPWQIELRLLVRRALKEHEVGIVAAEPRSKSRIRGEK